MAQQLRSVDDGALAICGEGNEPSELLAFVDYRRKGSSTVSSSASGADAAESEGGTPFYTHVLYKVDGRVALAGKGDRLDAKLLVERCAFVLDTVCFVVLCGFFAVDLWFLFLFFLFFVFS